jgi:hypothetical protein
MYKQGQTSTTPAEEDMYMMDVSPEFFATLGIPVQRGRGLTDRDGASAPKVAILIESAARALFPDGDALGRRVGESFEKSGEFEVVGVVRDTKYASVRDPGPPTMYRCAFQSPLRSLNVVLRTAGDPLAMTETVRVSELERLVRFNHVAILNESAARALFPDGNALGRRVGESFEKSGEVEVVGVVRDTKYATVRDPGPPTMYRSVWQHPGRGLDVVLRTTGEPLAMSETVRAAMRDIDPTVPIPEFTSQSEHISQRFAQERLLARAYAAFGALAVLLACIGLFGLMSYSVARRTSEIGVRMALGAQRRTVVGMVMGESSRPVAVGIVLGIGAVLWAGRFVQTVVYGVSPGDPLTIGGAVALIAVVTTVAGGLPARRASNVNPIEALRR